MEEWGIRQEETRGGRGVFDFAATPRGLLSTIFPAKLILVVYTFPQHTGKVGEVVEGAGAGLIVVNATKWGMGVDMSDTNPFTGEPIAKRNT
jgi:hypothetical protein